MHRTKNIWLYSTVQLVDGLNRSTKKDSGSKGTSVSAWHVTISRLIGRRIGATELP